MKELTCIVCPNGCHLQVEQHGENIVVEGNLCKRGEVFAINELTCPMRTIASTVKTTFKDYPVISVRVSGGIPKAKIFDVMQEIQKVIVDHPVQIGDIIIQDVCHLGVDIIATMPLS